LDESNLEDVGHKSNLGRNADDRGATRVDAPAPSGGGLAPPYVAFTSQNAVAIVVVQKCAKTLR